jgi:hypothetical protein
MVNVPTPERMAVVPAAWSMPATTNSVTDRPALSTSESFVSTFPVCTVSSAPVLLSATTIGASFVPRMLTVMVLVVPSAEVMVRESV